MLRVPPSLFPGDDETAFLARLEGYLAQGEELARGLASASERDRAAAAYAEATAYRDAYLIRCASPSSTSLPDGGSMSYSDASLERLKAEADARATAFAALVPAAVPADDDDATPSALSLHVHHAWPQPWAGRLG